MAIYIQGQEVTSGDRVGIVHGLAFDLKRSCLASAGVAEQDIGWNGTEGIQRPGHVLLIVVRIRDLSTGPEYSDDIVHTSSNQSGAGTVRNSSSGMPPSPTSSERLGLKRCVNSSIPRIGFVFSPLLTSMAMV